MRKRLWGGRITALLLALVCASSVLASEANPPPKRRVARLLLISVDGLRPDLLLRADAPAIRRLMERGCFTMWARTTAVSVTLPSHVSMLTGVTPAKHRIEWNVELPLEKRVDPAWPTLFELAHRAGLSTAMAAGKGKFSALQVPGSLDWSFVPSTPVVADKVVADTAVSWIRDHAPRVLFVHLPDVDIAGHESGWGSPGQIAAITLADRSIARLVAALRSRRLLDSTLVLVTSDHGGAGFSHGADDVRSRTIPWIVAGPGICGGVDLTVHGDLEVRTEDTFATLCYLLGIAPSKPIDGTPVTAILCPPSSFDAVTPAPRRAGSPRR